MKQLYHSDLELIMGGFSYFGKTVEVSNEGIPDHIFQLLEMTTQNALEGKWGYCYSIAYLCANKCMPYYSIYKLNLSSVF